jgi:hypothetical protein
VQTQKKVQDQELSAGGEDLNDSNNKKEPENGLSTPLHI